MPGEDNHEKGRLGALSAKTWLERTGRADVMLTAYDALGAPHLTFKKSDGSEYSFDLFGSLYLDEGQLPFYGEVKSYTTLGHQASMYSEYLAQCYHLTVNSGAKPFHFLWLTWHPFSQGKWSRLCEPSEIAAALGRYPEYYDTDEPDLDLCNAIADRLLLIVLSPRQERLSLSDQQLGLLKKAMISG